MSHPYLAYSSEVQQALQAKQPVLALETALLTHGLPHPHNIETVLAMEQIAKEQGVTPATIALMRGKIKIGLTHAEIEHLGQDKNIAKVNAREISYALSQNLDAGTTVSATLFCAAQAGLKIFSTGGIGGVHRGEAMDISADLTALANHPLAVVCSGAKAILDIAKTLELLETFNVPVIGYQTKFFPAFYTQTSPYKLEMQADDLATLTTLLKTHWQLNMSSSVLIANPIPKEYEIPHEIIEPAIETALAEAKQQNIGGKAITPFLLNKIAQLTQTTSLRANIALIKNNVKLGAELAKSQLNLRIY